MSATVRYPLHERLLLTAVLGDANSAPHAWREWRKVMDLDEVDFGSQRLLPLLYRNLTALGVDDPELKRLKGVCRHTWSKNQMMMTAGTAVLAALHDQGIETMVLKGAALVMGGYWKAEERPMNDFDVVVPPGQVRAALAVLDKAGFLPAAEGPQSQPRFAPTYLQLWHSHGFRDRVGHQLDLHWHVLNECCYDGADDAFWQAAIPVTWRGLHTRVLGPADQVLHLCVHGMYGRLSEGVSVLRWAPDVVAVLRRHPDRGIHGMDWPRLLDQAERRRLVLPLRAALEFLNGLPGAGTIVPAEFLSELRATRPGPLEAREFRMRTRGPGMLGYLPSLWLHYRRNGDAAGTSATFGGFLEFMRALWGVDTRAMPGVAFGMGVRLLRRKLGISNDSSRTAK